jgi:hypothetical protein
MAGIPRRSSVTSHMMDGTSDVNDGNGGRRPGQYWPAPLADSASQTPPEIVIPERRLSRHVVGFCVIAGLVIPASIVAFFAIRGHENSRPPHTITIPASVEGYERMTGSVANRTAEAMRQAARNGAEDGSSAAGDVADKAVIGVYQQGDDPHRRVVFIGATAATNHELGKELRAHSASRNAGEIFDGEGGITGTRDFEPGPFGGVLRCGAGSGATTAMCVWADGSTIGMFLASDGDVGALARLALDFRSAAEH